MKTIELRYPDAAHLTKVLDDLTVLSRNRGQKGHMPTIAFDFEDDALEGLQTKLQQRGVTAVNLGND